MVWSVSYIVLQVFLFYLFFFLICFFLIFQLIYLIGFYLPVELENVMEIIFIPSLLYYYHIMLRTRVRIGLFTFNTL